MATKVRFNSPMEGRNFTADSIVYYPHHLVAHFEKNAELEIKPGISFYVWLKGEALEWENNEVKKMNQIQAIFNRLLQPTKKSVRTISSEGSVKLETFNDGFSILTSNHPLIIRVQ